MKEILTANEMISEEEKDILEEIMNIGFGNATADLAEVIDIYVQLSVPNIQIAKVGELPEHLKNSIRSADKNSIVYQKFWGEFSGSGLLILPSEAAKSLLANLMYGEPESVPGHIVPTLEEDSLLEIGNILIGACVGKIAELLNTFSTYTPPQIISNFIDDYDSFVDTFATFHTAIVMKTVFKFEKTDLDGVMMLLASQESIRWLRRALRRFLEPYK